MGIRPYCFCLSLLVALGSGDVPAAADPLLSPGTGLALSPGSASVFPIDVEGLAQTLCNEVDGPGPSPGIHYVKCTVTVKNADPTNGIKLDLTRTPCGVWDTLLIVGLTHLPILSTGAQGAALAMNTNLHFTNRETGQTADLALHFGPGSADPSAPATSEVSGAGRLISFRDDDEEEGSKIWEFQDCIPESFTKLYPSYENVGDVCPACPSSPDVTSEGGEGSDPGH